MWRVRDKISNENDGKVSQNYCCERCRGAEAENWAHLQRGKVCFSCRPLGYMGFLQKRLPLFLPQMGASLFLSSGHRPAA